MRELAKKLVRATGERSPDVRAPQPVLVNEQLRNSLIRLAGADGVASVLRRALALASAEIPALQSLKLGANGQLEGNEHLGDQGGALRDAAATAITMHLLELLVTFIGEGLTRRLVREACPETPPDA